MKTKIITTIAIGVLILGGFVGLLVYAAGQPGKYDNLAQCLKDGGSKFYGAFWCPHCQATKALFGKSAKKLPYIECSTADGKGALPVCTDNDIKGYPTWVFPDGSRLTGEQSLQTLADKTNCPLN